MHDARTVLAELLSQLEAPDADHTLRLQAAMMANRLALFHGDPSLSDVAESLVLDTDEATPSHILEGLTNESAVARATRRAIALSHRQQLRSKKDLTLSLAADPAVLLRQVREQVASGEKHLARSTLEIALARHPDDPGLVRAQAHMEAAGLSPDVGQDSPLPTG